MTESNKSPELVSAKVIQRSLGIVGLLFPLILYLGNLIIFDESKLQSSLSGYYNTPMRDVFVGVLFSFAVALMAYKGYELIDNIIGDFAAIAAVGVALFGTPAEGVDDPTARITHGIFSILFYGSLVIFAIWLFRKSAPGTKPTEKKVRRNQIYLVSGIVMLISIVIIALTWLFDLDLLVGTAIFWFETLANTAFGVSWFVKGGLIPALNDEPHN